MHWNEQHSRGKTVEESRVVEYKCAKKTRRAGQQANRPVLLKQGWRLRKADGWKGEVPMPPPKEQAYGWKLEWDVEGAPREKFEGPVHQCAGSGDELSKLEVGKKRCVARQADTNVEPEGGIMDEKGTGLEIGLNEGDSAHNLMRLPRSTLTSRKLRSGLCFTPNDTQIAHANRS